MPITQSPCFALLTSPANTIRPRTPPHCSLRADDLHAKEVVCLGSQRVGDAGASSVAKALAHPQTRIRHVNLDSCEITCAGARALATALRTNGTLEELVLYDNAIGDDGAAALADALVDAVSALRVLSLARNRVGAAGGVALGRMLARNVALRNVYLMGQVAKGGGIGDEGALAFAEGIRGNDGAFWFVNLNGNAISERGLDALREARVHGKHVVFPVDPYPGPRTASKSL